MLRRTKLVLSFWIPFEDSLIVLTSSLSFSKAFLGGAAVASDVNYVVGFYIAFFLFTAGLAFDFSVEPLDEDGRDPEKSGLSEPGLMLFLFPSSSVSWNLSAGGN